MERTLAPFGGPGTLFPLRQPRPASPPSPQLVWAPESSDHQPVVLTVEPVEGERGRDRESIREDLIFEPRVQRRLMEITKAAYEGASSKVKKWGKAMNIRSRG